MLARLRRICGWINSRPRAQRFAINAAFGAVLSAVGIPLVYLLLGISLGAIAVNRDFSPAERGIEIFVWSNGVHADLVLPARTAEIDWTALFPPDDFKAVPRNPRHVAIGWGDRDFYLKVPQWSDLSFGVAFKSLFLPSESAMHVTYCGPPIPGESCKRTMITAAQYRLLIQHIKKSVRTDGTGCGIAIPAPGYSDRDIFYEADGSYNLIGNCNEWTGAGLRRAGVRMGLWTPLAGSVLDHLE